MPTLEEVRSRRDALTDQLLEAGDKLAELRDKTDRDGTWASDVRAATAVMTTLDSEQAGLTRWLEAQTPPPAPESRGPSAAFVDLGGERRSPGELFVASEAYTERRGNRQTGEYEVRNLLALSGGTGQSSVWAPVGQPWQTPPIPYRDQAAVRSLMSVQPTTLSSVPYIREVSALTNQTGASAVGEASAKQEVTMQFSQDDAPIRKLAGWIQITEEAVSDAPTLRGYVDSRLAYMLLVTENKQFLFGGGTSPDVKGILAYSGVQQVGATSGDFPATIGNGLGKVEVVGGSPNGVVMHPTDYWTMQVTRHSSFLDQGLGGNLPYGGPQQSIWGVPVVRTVAMQQNYALVGDFRMGAIVFDREQVTIRVTDSHASLFISNTLVILAEERVGLAVPRPDFFASCKLS